MITPDAINLSRVCAGAMVLYYLKHDGCYGVGHRMLWEMISITVGSWRANDTLPSVASHQPIFFHVTEVNNLRTVMGDLNVFLRCKLVYWRHSLFWNSLIKKHSIDVLDRRHDIIPHVLQDVRIWGYCMNIMTQKYTWQLITIERVRQFGLTVLKVCDAFRFFFWNFWMLITLLPDGLF